MVPSNRTDAITEGDVLCYIYMDPEIREPRKTIVHVHYSLDRCKSNRDGRIFGTLHLKLWVQELNTGEYLV